MARSFKTDLIVITFLLLVSSPLRFIDLGYSEFQDDERKALLRPKTGQTTYQFLLQNRKGPMQFLVTQIPYAITKDYQNELAMRLPFTIANLASVAVLYLLLRKMTGSVPASIFGSLLYSFNGFVVGFSRIAQYQSLNLLFSFTALYFYIDLVSSNKRLIVKTLLGTVFFCLSVFSHWDAVFILVPIIYFLVRFLARKDIESKYKIRLVFLNLVLGSLILLPFMIPYLDFHTSNDSSKSYFSKRVGLSTYSIEKHKMILELYNPFIMLPFYLIFTGLSLIYIRRNHVLFLWLIVNFVAIRYFMAKPGTHVYNYVIPAIFIMSVSVAFLLEKQGLVRRYVMGLFAAVVAFLFFYQSYTLFVDHTVEYPWQSKKVLLWNTVPYVNKEVLTFGFPHFRDWKNINKLIIEDGEGCGYITNEGVEISGMYMTPKYGNKKKCYFVVNVKKPFISTRDNVSFSEVKGLTPAYRYVKGGDSIVKVYKVNVAGSSTEVDTTVRID